MRKKTILVPMVIILLVVYAYFGLGYLKELKEHKVLASQLADINQTLTDVTASSQDLEQRMSAVQASLAVEQNRFPEKVNSTQVINSILQLADDTGVKAIPLVTQPWSIENVGEYDYYVFRLNVSVTGDFSQLVNFISQIEDSEFSTLIFDSLSVSVVPEQSSGDNTTYGTAAFSASLDMEIYAQAITSD